MSSTDEIVIHIGKEDVDCYNHVLPTVALREQAKHGIYEIDAHFLSQLRLMAYNTNPKNPTTRIRIGDGDDHILVFRFTS